MTTKILDGFRRKERTGAIFFNIEKTYNNINRNKTFEHMRIQEQMMEFIRGLISERCIKVQGRATTSMSRQTDLGILEHCKKFSKS